MIHVPARGNRSAKIMLVGEAPGAVEEKLRQPFVGPAGNVLKEILLKAGIDPDECYYTNLCKYRPPANDLSAWIPKGIPNEQVCEGLIELQEEIDSIKPNVIVPLGNWPLWAFYRNEPTGISSYRGYILEARKLARGAKLVPTLHPSYLLRGAFAEIPLAVFDLSRARKEASFPEVRRIKRVSVIDPRGAERDAVRERLLSEGRWLSVDIEYIGTRLLCVGFATAKDYSATIRISGPEDMAFCRELVESGRPLLMQNGMFDCGILEWHYGWDVFSHLDYDTMVAAYNLNVEQPKGLDFLAGLYTDLPPWWEEIDGAFWKGVKAGTQSITKMLPYNCIDAMATYEIAEKQDRELDTDPKLREAFTFDMAKTKPLWDMARRGVKVDVDVVNSIRNQAIHNADEAQTALDAIAETLGMELKGGSLNVKSSLQIIEFVFGWLGVTPTKRTPGGGWATDNKTLMECMRTATDEMQRKSIKLILTVREARDVQSKFTEIEWDDDLRARCIYDTTKTTTRRLSSKKFFPTGKGCLLPEAEVLTLSGWKRLDEISNTEVVMQWEPSGRLSWCNAVKHEEPFDGLMIEANAQFHKNVYTADHRVPVLNKYAAIDSLKVRPAREAVELRYWSLPVAGSYVGFSGHHPERLRLLAAIQADGSIEGKQIRLAFKKQRKIDRLQELAAAAGVKLSEQVASPGMRRFAISKDDAAWYIEQFYNGTKIFDFQRLLNCDKESLEAFIEEVGNWDATRRGRSYMYFTTELKNAETIATLAHLVNRSATIRVNYDNNRGYGQGHNKPLYTVAVKPRSYTMCEPKHFRERYHSGKVYCVQTKSSFFLSRYNGVISVTGNTNLQNIPAPSSNQYGDAARKCFVADPGYEFAYADLKGAEFLVVAELTQDPLMLKYAQMTIDGSGDVHRETASYLFGIPVDQIAKDSPQRFLGKKTRHSGNYMIGWKQFMENVNKEALRTGVTIDAATSKRLMKGYVNLHPGLQTWWDETEQELRRARALRNLFGFIRRFNGNTSQSLPVAVAFVPQSTVGDYLNFGLLACAQDEELKYYDFQLLLQVHDAIGFQYPLSNRHDVLARVRKLMDIGVRIPKTGKMLHIPVEIQCGPSWGEEKVYEDDLKAV